MTESARDTDSLSEFGAWAEALTLRELRASRVAVKEGLILRKLDFRCGGDDSCRYDLIYARYAQPSAACASLKAIETWLGIQWTTRR